MRDIVIHMLSIKGFAQPAVVAEAVGCSEEDAGALLSKLEAEGLSETTRMGARLTEEGKGAAERALVEQREAGDGALLAAFYESFDPINAEYKAALAAWQMRDGPEGPVPNDHGDPDYDAQVRKRMFARHEELLKMLRDLDGRWPMLADYGRRLSAAKDRADAGEQRYVAAPLIDSYHTVWFELHEALIRLSGRTRAEEASAGRAL